VGELSGRFHGVDRAIAAVFSMLGVVPLLASLFVLLGDARAEARPADRVRRLLARRW